MPVLLHIIHLSTSSTSRWRERHESWGVQTDQHTRLQPVWSPLVYNTSLCRIASVCFPYLWINLITRKMCDIALKTLKSKCCTQISLYRFIKVQWRWERVVGSCALVSWSEISLFRSHGSSESTYIFTLGRNQTKEMSIRNWMLPHGSDTYHFCSRFIG